MQRRVFFDWESDSARLCLVQLRPKIDVRETMLVSSGETQRWEIIAGVFWFI